MFSAFCPRHGKEFLFSSGRIRVLRSTARGIEVELDCYCGEHLRVLTGRRAQPALV